MLGHVARSIGNALPGGKSAPSLPMGVSFNKPGTFTWTAPEDGTAIVMAWGAGGTGINTGSYRSGSGGGGYCRKTVVMAKNQTISGTVGGRTASNGAAGGSTVVNFPDASLMTAGGGSGSVGNSSVTPIGPAGGVATGGDVNSDGGSGGSGQSGSSAVGGSPGVYGAPGGAAGPFVGGGGGAGGDPILFSSPGAGSSASDTIKTGGSFGGGVAGGNLDLGGPAAVFIFFSAGA